MVIDKPKARGPLTRTRFAKGKWWRKCGSCDKWLNLETQFTNKRKGQFSYYSGLPPLPSKQSTCRRCMALRQQRIKYGLTAAELAALPTSCETCGSTENLHIDHCHTTGKVRGRLCSKCNVVVGMAKESIQTLEAIINYLRKHQG